MLDEKGHTVRPKPGAKYWLLGEPNALTYWCLGLASVASAAFGSPPVPLEGVLCNGKAPSFYGLHLICLPQPKQYVCGGKCAASAVRVCESPDPPGNVECIEASNRGKSA